MSPDALESDIQDYVDGRMPEPRRRAFEARIAADPELARRVHALREIGAALAGRDEGLSPDFYTRLRSRFEASGPARPRWTRTHRWEAYGLAAAALIAIALFVPQLWTDRLPVTVAPARREAQATPVPGPPRGIGLQKAAQRSANEAPKKQEEESGERSAEREPPRGEPIEREAVEQRARPAPDRARDSTLDEPAPSAGAAQPEEYASAAAPAPQAAPSTFAPPTGLPVRPGLVDRDGLVEIDDRAGWEGLELAAIGRYDPARRVVLVGDRDGGLDCAASRLVMLEEAHEIRLVRQAPDVEQDGHACAFVLPRDARPVRVVGPLHDGR